MARTWMTAGVGAALAGLMAGAAPALAAGPTANVAYSTPGHYAFVVPAGVTSLDVTAIGGAGGSCSGAAGGRGASVSATVAVTPGEQLAVGVGGSARDCSVSAAGAIGGGGPGGSSSGTGAGGGGASVVSAAAVSPGFSTELVVAGAGGGADIFGGSGGDAGSAGSTGVLSGPGGAGTTSAGGAGGIAFDGAENGQAGSFGIGGAGGGGPTPFAGAGGGGGYYGGGGSPSTFTPPGAGAGGGSSYVDPTATVLAGATPTSAAPSVTITYAVPAVSLSPGALSFGSQPQGSVGAAQAVTVTNAGAAPLIVSGTQVTGAQGGDFLIADGCLAAVAPGATCQIGVRFAPQATGASGATLTLLSNAAPASIALSGTGVAAATGPAGPAGPQGPAGPRGPAGPAGTIVCQNTVVAKALCTLEFAPGTFTSQAHARLVSFAVVQGRHTVRSGRLPLSKAALQRLRVGKLAHGRYTLVITSGAGRHAKVLLRLRFTVR